MAAATAGGKGQRATGKGAADTNLRRSTGAGSARGPEGIGAAEAGVGESGEREEFFWRVGSWMRWIVGGAVSGYGSTRVPPDSLVCVRAGRAEDCTTADGQCSQRFFFAGRRDWGQR